MMALSADQRRAFAMIATAGKDGVAQALLSAHGFDATMIADLVNRGPATLTMEKGSDKWKADRGRLGKDQGNGTARSRCRGLSSFASWAPMPIEFLTRVIRAQMPKP